MPQYHSSKMSKSRHLRVGLNVPRLGEDGEVRYTEMRLDLEIRTTDTKEQVLAGLLPAIHEFVTNFINSDYEAFVEPSHIHTH